MGNVATQPAVNPPNPTPTTSALSSPKPIPFGQAWSLGLGIYLVVSALIFVYELISIWPYSLPLELDDEDVFVFPAEWARMAIGPETRLLLIAFFSGALGSQIHAMRSFAYWIGMGKSDRRWIPWYCVHPVVGGGLAVAVYLGVRGGFFGNDNAPQDMSVYGIGAFAIMTGLFSQQAINKLSEVFDTLFSPRHQPPTAPGEQTPAPVKPPAPVVSVDDANQTEMSDAPETAMESWEETEAPERRPASLEG